MNFKRSLLLAILLCASPIQVLGLDPIGTYNNEPVSFDQNADLWYGVDLDSRIASLAIHVKDSAEINADSSTNWIGVGVSEPSSGSMIGADIVTATFTSSQNTECAITDRYVPFYAYPLGESTMDSPSAFPLEDDCQDDDSWVLVRCERDIGNGEMILEVTRSLDAHDTQDREIPEGLNSMIYSYGGNFQYHGTGRRGAQKVELYRVDGNGPPTSGIISDTKDLPDDIDGSFDVLATNYTIPANSTTIYSCTSAAIELGENGKKMLIAVDPIISSPINMVHHFTIYLCSGKKYAEKVKETIECTTSSENDIDGPIANPEANCHTLVYGYAKGIKRLIIPKEAGFLATEESKYIIMETHFDNTRRIEGNIDNSGVRIYYTNTMRQHEAASLLVGDQLVQRSGEVIQSGFKYQYTCPSECTNNFNRPINIFSSFLHMHTTGKEIYTNKFSEDGEYIETIGKINFWSDKFQQIALFDPPISLNPGEQLQTTCIYDTSKRPDTTFGLETLNEMCMDFLSYWPAQKDPSGNEFNICAFVLDQPSGDSSTFCGDNGNITETIPVTNPKFDDDIGAPTTFGEEIDECPIPGIESPEPTSTSTQPPSATTISTETTTSTVTTNAPSTSTGASTSPEPEASPACFPASARVTLKGGYTKRMDSLSIGDEVLVSDDEFSKIFMFTHKDPKGRFEFVELETYSGRKVRATTGHLIYVNGTLMEAGNVIVGDSLSIVGGNMDMVTRVGRVEDVGLFNPQTIHGNIVVEGIVVSTYTRAIPSCTAHSLLAPLRWFYEVSGIDVSHFAL